MVNLINNRGFKWKNKAHIWFKGYLFDGNHLKTDQQIFSELENIQTKQHLTKWLNKSRGCFSIVIKADNTFLCAVDNIRTFPLFYSANTSGLIITDDPVSTFNKINKMDPLSVFELESAAYVTGNRTLFQDVYQVEAGEIIDYTNNKIERSFYTDFWIDQIDTSDFEQLKQKLSEKLNESFERFVHSLEGRQVIVPLSGGYDSRLIAVMLKKIGYTNVYTFTYGKKGNQELENSQKTAQKLGYSWKFIEYNEKLINDFIHDDIFFSYCNFAGKGCSMFYMQDYFAVKHLHEHKLINKDAIFVPGHSGDSIAGSHLKKTLEKTSNKNDLISAIYKKTYNQNEHKKYRSKFIDVIRKFIEKASDNNLDYNIYESWIYFERQSKFIVNSSNVFDFFGYEYRLPFWDQELINFFKSVPFKYKLNKKLYKKTLKSMYFEPYSIDFENEIQATSFDIRKQILKDKVRPLLPFKTKLHYLEKNDWMTYSIITNYFLNDLKTNNIRYKFKADSYNSIISKWYVEFTKSQK